MASSSNNYKTTVPGFANSIEERKFRIQYVAEIAERVGKKIGRKITKDEIQSIKGFIDTLDIHDLRKNGGQIIAKYTLALGSEEEEEIDTSEYLKGIIGLNSEDTTGDKWNHERLLRERRIDENEQKGQSQSVSTFLGLREPHDLAYVINPLAQRSISFIELDSRYRNLASSDGSVSVSFTTRYGGGFTNAQGVAPHRGPIRDITGFQFIQLSIPTPANYQPYYGEMTILIQEFNDSAIPVRDCDWSYHMKFRIESIDGNDRLSLIPLFADGRIELPNTIPEISKLTFSFGSPYSPVTFHADRMLVNFTTGAVTTITTPSAHNLSTNDIVFFNTDNPFNTDQSNSDFALISQINNKQGLQITVTTGTAFTIDVNTTGLNGTPTSAICYFGSKRIMVTLQVIHQRPKYVEKR